MARKLAGFPGNEPGAAIEAKEPQAAETVKKTESRWLPYTTAEELPPANVVKKNKVVTLKDGTQFVTEEVRSIKAGEPRYRVNEYGELLALYNARGGVHQRLVRQFKAKFPQNPDGMAKKVAQEAFRRKLRAAGIPGA